MYLFMSVLYLNPAIVDQATSLTASTASTSSTIPISPSSPTQHLFQPAFHSPGRIFTDLFSGYDSPLSSAILDKGCQIFRMDILIDPIMDILSDDFAEQLLPVCTAQGGGGSFKDRKPIGGWLL